MRRSLSSRPPVQQPFQLVTPVVLVETVVTQSRRRERLVTVLFSPTASATEVVSLVHLLRGRVSSCHPSQASSRSPARTWCWSRRRRRRRHTTSAGDSVSIPPPMPIVARTIAFAADQWVDNDRRLDVLCSQDRRHVLWLTDRRGMVLTSLEHPCTGDRDFQAFVARRVWQRCLACQINDPVRRSARDLRWTISKTGWCSVTNVAHA